MCGLNIKDQYRVVASDAFSREQLTQVAVSYVIEPSCEGPYVFGHLHHQ